MNFLTLIIGSLKLVSGSIRHGVFSIPFENSSNVLIRSLSFVNPFYYFFKDLREGERLAALIESQGPVFIKFGQLLSTRTDILDAEVAKDLQVLTDQCKNFDNKIARKIIEKELGSKIEDVFDDFDEDPIAAASLAQVHTARIKNTDKDVVIKVLRPGIRKKVERNVRLLKGAAAVFNFFYKDSHRLKPKEVIKNYEETIYKELDLKLEAANTNLTRKNFLNSKRLYIPEVYWELTTSDVFTLERIDGIPCTAIDEIEAHNIDKKLLAENGVTIFLDQVFRDNFFHADMHPGNIFVSKEHPESPGYIAIDCAITGSLSNEERYTLARMLQAVLKQNYRSLAQLFINSHWVDSETNLLELENTLRACCEPIFEKPLSEIEFGKLLLYLFQSTRRFGLSLQPSLVLLQKTLIHIEGMGRQIYPELNFWGIAEPYLDNWLLEQFNPLNLKDFILENKEDILHKTAEIPSFIYEILDELRSYSKNKQSSDAKIQELKIQLLKEKYFIRLIALGIALAIAAMLFLS
jgi:ubiquinone biosynthesis protein